MARYAETRSPGLKEEVAETFTPLALALADRYGVGLEIDDGDSATIDDLAEVANLSLLEAIDEFDPALGEPFRSHATPRILGELQRHLREHVWT